MQVTVPRVAVRNLFWSKVPRKAGTIWACTAGPPGLADPHLKLLESLFVQAAATPMTRKGGPTSRSEPAAPF